MKPNFITIGFATLLTLTVLSCRQNELIAFHDENGDGKLSRAEFVDGIETQGFLKIDRNGDLTISETEWNRASENNDGLPGPLFSELDADGDGKLDSYEYKHAPATEGAVTAFFNDWDANGDGFLTKREIEIP
mgnify:CR=1 FL=1